MSLTLEIEHDPDFTPREWDNLGHMLCYHRKYTLGDKEIPEGCDPKEHESWVDIEDVLRKKHDAVIVLPLFLFDHSGLTMQTSSDSYRRQDSAGWDWGQVGLIWTSRKEVREAYMVKRLTADVRRRATQCLIGEVADYARYLEGDVWGYVIRDDRVVVDSCWGFIGRDEVEAEGRQSLASWQAERDQKSVATVAGTQRRRNLTMGQ